jgi:hypothetical protein
MRLGFLTKEERNIHREGEVSLPTSAPHGGYLRMICQPSCGVVFTATSFPASTAFNAASAEAAS